MIGLPAERRLWWGLVAAAFYAGTALLTSAGRPGLLFDGLGPPPRYNWVRPPSVLARGNMKPEPGRGTLTIFREVSSGPGVSLTPGSQSGSLSTPDGQSTVLFVRGAFAPQPGESSVTVTFTPLDPETLAPPPSELRFDANAYRIEAAYSGSGMPARLQKPAVVFLRYASGGTTFLHLNGNVWRSIESRRYHGSNALEAEVSGLGVFVAAAPKDYPFTRRGPWWTYALLILLLLPPVVIVAWVIYKATRQPKQRLSG